MGVPGTYQKSSLLREVEYLRLAPEEMLILRFPESATPNEMQEFAREIHGSIMRNRVLCMKFNGQIVVAEK